MGATKVGTGSTALVGTSGRKHSGRGPTDRLAQAEETLRLYKGGMSQPAIAKQLGISGPTVCRRLKLALEQRIAENADEYRKIEQERLDDLHAVTMRTLELGMTTLDTELVLKATDRVLKISAQRAALLGLNAPVRIDATVMEVTQEDVELAEMIREAKAKAANSQPVPEG